MLLAAGVEALRLAVWPAGSWQKAYMAGARGPEVKATVKNDALMRVT